MAIEKQVEVSLHEAPTMTTEEGGAGTTNLMLEAALRYAAIGWAVVPMLPQTNKCILEGWDHLATTDPATIHRFWNASPSANVGIVAGASGMIVVDVDMHHGDGLATWRAIAATLDPSLIRTPTEQTPTGGGLHLYFRTCSPSLLPLGKLLLGPEVELIIRSHCSVASPSIRPNGRYAWLPGMAPWNIPLLDFPSQLIARIIRAPDHAGAASTVESDSLLSHDRNCTLTSAGGALRRHGLNEEGIQTALLKINAAVCDPPLDASEVRSIARSLGKYPPAAPAPVTVATSRRTCPKVSPDLLHTVHTTDAGAAEVFRSLYADRVRYDHTTHHWYVFHAPLWREDCNEEIVRLVLEVPRALFASISDIEDTEFAAKIGRWAASLESAKRQEAMLQLARSLEPISTTDSAWDPDPNILGCKNGLLDLKTGLLRAGKPQDMVSRSTGIAVDPDATCPRWQRFVDEVFGSDADTISFVQRAVGYSLTADISEQCVFLLHGNGANGKSTLTSTLANLLGEYSGNAPFSTFEATRQQSATNDIAALAGKRFVTSSEASEQRQMNEARIKAITGGDAVSARFLYSEYFQYVSTYHIWLSMNELPRVAGTDNGIWRRIRLIPFNESFVGREDRHLGTILKAELPGIMNWALQGLAEWRRIGLGTAKQVSEATSAYRSSSDLVRQFLDECTMKTTGGWTRAAVLYANFSTWCAMRNTRPPSENYFGRRLSELGYQSVRDKNSRGYRDVRFLG